MKVKKLNKLLHASDKEKLTNKIRIVHDNTCLLNLIDYILTNRGV